MKTAFALIAVVAVPWLFAGCAAEPPPPAVDLAADRAAVEQVLRDQLTGTNRPGEEGADGYVSVATEDIIVLQPNAERVDGREAVRAYALAFTSADEWSVSWTATQVEVAAAGDLAYAIGTYELSLKDAEGNAVADEGKFLNVFEKQADGSWKLSVISYNSDLPVGGAGDPEG